MASEENGYVEITCVDPQAFRRWTQERWYENIDKVLAADQQWRAGEIRKNRLKEVIKVCGYCPTEDGLLADMELRPSCNLLP